VKTTSASFEFTSSETGSGFDCSLDGRPFAACSSPISHTGLMPGAHTFSARATDAAGNSDPTPAVRTWTVIKPRLSPRSRPSQTITRTGTARRDVLRGTPGPDVLRGLGGSDLLYGIRGNDALLGGSGQDRLLAGAGNDVVQAKDDVRDTIACGPGRDVVYADPADYIARDCEVVRRSGPRT
jgi:Ca2+-binding RTX toxin-like protein